MKVRDIYNILNEWAPFRGAYDFDNVGLLVGDMEQPVHKVMLALDPSLEVIEQAVKAQVQLLITHHPLTLEKIKTVTRDTHVGRMLHMLIANQISLIAAHTNLDVAQSGVNDVLAECLNLQDVHSVVDKYHNDHVKFTVFVPKTHTESLLEGLNALRIAIFDGYDSCTFTSNGTGRFRPCEGADPFVGTVGSLASVAEDRVEMLIPKERMAEIIEVVKQHHPYEQPAYEIIEVQQPQLGTGILRIGRLPKPLTTRAWARILREQYGFQNINYTLPDKLIQSVAVCGGSGIDLFRTAQQHGADVLVTGEMKYHVAQEACVQNMAVVTLGHQESELPVVGALASRLSVLQLDVHIAQELPYIHSVNM